MSRDVGTDIYSFSINLCWTYASSYELIFSRLIKHTDIDHPDQKPLQDALKLVHDILLHLNCKKKEALENGQREAALRDLEVCLNSVYSKHYP